MYSLCCPYRSVCSGSWTLSCTQLSRQTDYTKPSFSSRLLLLCRCFNCRQVCQHMNYASPRVGLQTFPAFLLLPPDDITASHSYSLHRSWRYTDHTAACVRAPPTFRSGHCGQGRRSESVQVKFRSSRLTAAAEIITVFNVRGQNVMKNLTQLFCFAFSENQSLNHKYDAFSYKKRSKLKGVFEPSCRIQHGSRL